MPNTFPGFGSCIQGSAHLKGRGWWAKALEMQFSTSPELSANAGTQPKRARLESPRLARMLPCRKLLLLPAGSFSSVAASSAQGAETSVGAVSGVTTLIRSPGPAGFNPLAVLWVCCCEAVTLAQTQRRSPHTSCQHRYLCQPDAWSGKKQQSGLTSPPPIQLCWPALIAFPSPHTLLLCLSLALRDRSRGYRPALPRSAGLKRWHAASFVFAQGGLFIVPRPLELPACPVTCFSSQSRC